MLIPADAGQFAILAQRTNERMLVEQFGGSVSGSASFGIVLDQAAHVLEAIGSVAMGDGAGIFQHRNRVALGQAEKAQ